MDPLMMWPLLVWILAVMLGRRHEYSMALCLRERWLLNVILEGIRGQCLKADSAFQSASIISKITVKTVNQSKPEQPSVAFF